MFIENGDPKKSSSLQRSETDAGVARHCRKHCAPLERGCGSQRVFYKHWAPLEPKHYLVAALAALGNLCVLCVSVVNLPIRTRTTETQMSLRTHREKDQL